MIFDYNNYNLYIEIYNYYIHNILNYNIINVIKDLYKSDYNLL